MMRAPVASLLLLAVACSEAAPASAPQTGTARMAALLDEFAQRVDPKQNMYLNVQRAAAHAAELAQPAPDGKPRLRLRLDHAYELMLGGCPREAADEFLAVRAELEKLGARANPQTLADLRRMLALAWMRVGEQDNCLSMHGPDSCLFPVAGGGVHGKAEGSRRAVEELLATLRDDPENHEAAWLLNVASMTLGEWPEGVPREWRIPEEALASPVPFPRFPDVAAEAGIDILGLAGGACMEDFDGDGRLDLLTSSWGLRDPLTFLHNDGDGGFSDRSAELGLPGITGGLNLLHADYDDDGDADVVVLRGAWFEQDGRVPSSLLRNDGKAHFEDVTIEAGLLSAHPTQTGAFADIDLDGDLDLYIGHETVNEVHPCELFVNRGDGTFEERGAAAGVDVRAYVKGVVFGDADGDGLPDLYVSAIDSPNRLFRNLGARDGVTCFEDVTARAGVVEPLNSFPAWFFDYDNDGALDLFASGYHFGSARWVWEDLRGLPNKGRKPRLHHNLGDGRFEDVTAPAGLEHVLLTMGCNWGDVDNDGWPDFYLATGEPDLAALFPNRLFLNDGGRRFLDVTTAAGMGHLQKGHGVAFGDIDEDGDQDVFCVLGGAYSGDVARAALYENPGFGRRWITLRLEGVRANRSAIGARVAARILEPGGERTVRTLVGTGGSFGSSSLQVELGLGEATRVVELRVEWPGGEVQVFDEVGLDRIHALREGGELEVGEAQPFRLGGAARG